MVFSYTGILSGTTLNQSTIPGIHLRVNFNERYYNTKSLPMASFLFKNLKSLLNLFQFVKNNIVQNLYIGSLHAG